MAALFLGAGWVRADIITCACDVSKPETLEARQCSLCREAEKQPAGVEVFVLKDVNPTKPGRWLVLPRAHDRSFAALPPELRLKLLSTAVERSRAMFGDEWGIAYNAPKVQTQCHVHIHLGKLIEAVETAQFVTIQRLEDTPVPPEGEGFWMHAQGGGFHVHTGEQITETVLLR